MRVSRRRVILLATLREMEATLTDAAIAMFSALMGRAHLRARKRLEQRFAISGREGRDRLMRIATVLETVSQAVAIRISRSRRSEEHTSELQSLMRTSYAVFCLKKKRKH